MKDKYAFLSNIITGTDTWVHHYESLIESSGMETYAITLQKKFKVQASAGKVMGSVFLDSEGILLVELLERGATVISEQYLQTLKKLKQ